VLGPLLAAVSVLGVSLAATVPAQPVHAARRCRIASPVEPRSWGDPVLCIERQLRSLGYLDTNIDVYYGTSTTSAVARFQRDRGLRATGGVSRRTARELGVWGATPLSTHRPMESRELGRSVNGRRIRAYRYGTPGGKVVVAVGQIHGNEQGGAMISAYLRVRGAPDGIDLWVVDSVNPDGWATFMRRNAHLVDLNRNFDSGNWVRTTPGTPTYSGPRPASEPETRAVQRLLDEVRPRLMIVWHQTGRHVDDNRSVADYSMLRRYSELTGFPIRSTPSCTRCGGTATSYVNRRIGTTAFTVEMPAAFTYATARRHGDALLAIAAES
jgi:protein MpaA